MKNTKIYIFNAVSIGAAYGIGTYIDQLTSCLKNAQVHFELILLHAKGDEMTVSMEKGYRQISIPSTSYRTQNDSKYYYRNVAYLLDEYITGDENTKHVFHLNFMSNPPFVSALKKRYACKVVLVCHYMNWSLSLLGDEKKLLTLLAQKSKERTSEGKRVCTTFRNDISAIKKCDRFVCIAKHALHIYLKTSDIIPEKCTVISNAIKDEYKQINLIQKQSIKRKYRIPEDTKVILYVGRLDEAKGVSSLIKAFKSLLGHRSDIHLILAGDGDLLRWLKESAYYWAKITFTGRLDKKQIYELYQMADIGVVCSIHEGFGLVAIEMMMQQLPVIVGDTGGLAEIVEDSISGIKVPVRTVKGKRMLPHTLLADKMERLLSDEEYASVLARNGRKRFLGNYEIKQFQDNIINLYKTI